MRVSHIFLLDVSAILLLSVLIIAGVWPLYPTAPLAYLLLLGVNVPLLLALGRDKTGTSVRGSSVPTSLWLCAGLFTPAGGAAVVAFARSPDLPLGVQASVAVLLVGYIWFLICRLYRSGGSHDYKGSEKPEK